MLKKKNLQIKTHIKYLWTPPNSRIIQKQQHRSSPTPKAKNILSQKNPNQQILLKIKSPKFLGMKGNIHHIQSIHQPTQKHTRKDKKEEE